MTAVPDHAASDHADHDHTDHDHTDHDHTDHDHTGHDHTGHDHDDPATPANGHALAAAALPADERAKLGRRAQLLATTSVAYNGVEAVVALAAGVVAGSAALLGFGLDSLIEVSSGLIILWQFRHRLPQSRERRAAQAIAVSFFLLAGLVTFESSRALLTGDEPDVSRVGIVLAAVSLVIMPVLSWAQRRTGRQLHSNAVVADGTQTLLCTYMSAVLLGGLLLNALLGWSWADPVAGLVIAAIAAKEGRDAWRGEGCCGVGSGHSDLVVVPCCPAD